MAYRVARFGWRPDLPDHRDHLFTAAPRPLPPRIDLRAACPPVYDQGELGSCTAHALAGAFEYDRRTDPALPDWCPSRLWIYYQERVLEHTVNEDAGAMIRDGIKVLAKLGAPPEPLWPYEPQAFAIRPPASVYEQARPHRVTSYARVLQSRVGVRQALASGVPVTFGFACYESLESPEVARTGAVPLPGPDEAQIGGHAVLLVGYDESSQVFQFRNSWGTAWGIQGYGTLPYAYVLDRTLAADFWVIRTTT